MIKNSRRIARPEQGNEVLVLRSVRKQGSRRFSQVNFALPKLGRFQGFRRDRQLRQSQGRRRVYRELIWIARHALKLLQEPGINPIPPHSALCYGDETR